MNGKSKTLKFFNYFILILFKKNKVHTFFLKNVELFSQHIRFLVGLRIFKKIIIINQPSVLD